LKGEYLLSGDPLLGQLLLQAALIALNAFFAMTEIAVLSCNENKIQRLAEEGNKKAARLAGFIEQPARFLATIQVGITLAGFLGSAFAAENFSDRLVQAILSWGWDVNVKTLNAVCVVVITLILSYFTLVFGELVPKRIAQKKAEAISLRISGVISAASAATAPLVWLLTASTNAVLRLFGINPNAEEEEVTEDEIRMMVDIGEEKGTIEADEREMIDNIFEFNDYAAEDVMIHRTDVWAISLEDTDEEIVSSIMESGLSRFPVYDEDIDDVIGILNVRDYLLNRLEEHPKPLRELIRAAYFVPHSVRCDVLFRDMQFKKIHMAIVVDEYGGTNGIVTMEDLLEQIVGNIYDEYDPAETEFEKIDESTYRISGGADLEEVSELLNVELPIDEYDTFGGMLFGQMNVIPEDGSQMELECYGLNIKVEKIEDHRVESALVCKCEPDEKAEAEE
jgi:putative hemolysin